MPARRAAVVTAAGLVLAAGAAPAANAATFCIDISPCLGTIKTGSAGFQQALDAAEVNNQADTIFLGAGTWVVS